MLTVRHHMLHQFPLLQVDTPLSQALDALRQSGLGGLPVVNGGRQLIGFLSERDCLPTLLSASYHCDVRTRVGDLMSQEPLAVEGKESLLALAERMTASAPRLYPVVEGGIVIGVIGRRQVMDALHHLLKACQPTRD
ncbi:CBS domain-containing protein [Aeromonas schubertii]|uniref:CBS domain-containing protein n=1 Tax=Aeromonas schubertii TaxID=652 RepID=UPI0038B560DA